MYYGISVDYLNRVNAFNFVVDYLRRNKIKHEIRTVIYKISEEMDQRINVEFKSVRQRNTFLRKGHDKFPYVEFI